MLAGRVAVDSRETVGEAPNDGEDASREREAVEEIHCRGRKSHGDGMS